VNPATAALAERAGDVARRAVELTCEELPAYAATLDARGRRFCEEDAGLHVRALIGSVAADDPKIFGDYAVWCADLLGRFGIRRESLAVLFRATGRAIEELVPAAAGDVEAHLEAGERALAP
jgi:hypothetical protein